jgi:hypothetical protein
MRATRFLAAMMLISCLAARAESPEKTAEEFVQLSTSQGPSAAVILYHPNDVQRVHDKVVLMCEREAESGRRQIRGTLFGAGVTLDDVHRMTPENLLLAIMAKLPARTTTYDEFKALGSVKEGENLHVVVRASLKKVERLKRRSIVQVVSLIPSGKEWRAAIPSGIEAYVDGVLAAAPDELPPVAPPAGAPAAGGAAPGVPAAKDPAWSAVLARGIDLLSRGNCLTYFLDVVEPGFSKTMSPKNFDAVVRGCELNEHTREKFRMGLELAGSREPKLEQGGSKVTYDLSGEGLPYDHLTLVRVDGRWYVSE